MLNNLRKSYVSYSEGFELHLNSLRFSSAAKSWVNSKKEILGWISLCKKEKREDAKSQRYSLCARSYSSPLKSFEKWKDFHRKNTQKLAATKWKALSGKWYVSLCCTAQLKGNFHRRRRRLLNLFFSDVVGRVRIYSGIFNLSHSFSASRCRREFYEINTQSHLMAAFWSH